MEFSLLISTRNRLSELKKTIRDIEQMVGSRAEILICDDHSTDGTYNYLKKNCPNFRIFRNSEQMGYLYTRNFLMSKVSTKYAMSLDDDAGLVSKNPLEKCKEYFDRNPYCGVLAFRIFWGTKMPSNIDFEETSIRVKGFVGCGHIWRMDAWKSIPNYPEWFKFYGEENFASFHLFKKDWDILYAPEILVQHRVDNIERKRDNDFYTRRKNGLKADWFNILLFYPSNNATRLISYSIFKQIHKAWNQRDLKALMILPKSIIEVLSNLKNIIRGRNQLTKDQFRRWKDLPNTKIYWSPKA